MVIYKNEFLENDDLVWLFGDSDNRGYYDLSRVTETIGGSYGVKFTRDQQ